MASAIYQCIEQIGSKIIENKEFLTELDREIGDADHGINMARGFTEALKALPQEEEDIGAVLKKTGMTLLSKVGGASGPLYGTAYMKAAKVAAGKKALTLEDGKAMMEEATKTIRATKGRASYLGDRSIGHQDPGATSSLYTLEAIRDFVKGL